MIVRALASLAATATLCLSAAIAAGAASAQPVSDCTSTHGTIVAVDFGHWHGPVVRGCGVGAATGLDLLHHAGFSTAGTVRDGPAFVCRLGSSSFAGGAQRPTEDEDPCVNTPPANAYWSFWVAPAGQNTWSYSKVGAAGDRPTAGEVEYWQYGATSTDGSSGAPSVAPAQLRAPAASPSSSAPHTTARPTTTRAASTHSATRSGSSAHSATASTAHGTSSSTGATTTRPAASSSTAAPRSRATSAQSSTASTQAVGTEAGSASSTPTIVAASGSAAAGPSSGSSSAAPAIAAGVLVVLLGGGAGFTVWRRRRTAA